MVCLLVRLMFPFYEFFALCDNPPVDLFLGILISCSKVQLICS
jgi:hypothetical protein